MLFDVIVIGAGIGGLTTAAYLTKAGIKVLLLEQSGKVGGYCGSFNYKGYRFDEAVHYVNHLGPKGILRRVLTDLALEDIAFVAVDPSDTVKLRSNIIRIYRNVSRTVDELSESFPSEHRAIKFFFDLICNHGFIDWYSSFGGQTFKQFLESYFKTDQLRLGLGLLATTLGVPPDKLSASAAFAYYKGSIIDGGYHPVGGAQSLSDGLANKIKQSGGIIKLQSMVQTILIRGSHVAGVKLESGETFLSKVVVSNCDATQTYQHLIGKEYLSESFLKRISDLRPSTSTAIIYLGVRKDLLTNIPMSCNYWYYPFDTLNEKYLDLVSDSQSNGFVHIGLSSLYDTGMAPPGRACLVGFCGASYVSSEYWRKEKARATEVLIARLSHALPSITAAIDVKLAATPVTLQRYTLNRDGAYRGWEPTPQQSKWGLVPRKGPVDGLFMTGHWVTTPAGNGGVSMAAEMGRVTAETILKGRMRNSVSMAIQKSSA